VLSHCLYSLLSGAFVDVFVVRQEAKGGKGVEFLVVDPCYVVNVKGVPFRRQFTPVLDWNFSINDVLEN